jgi:hypothetical protein
MPPGLRARLRPPGGQRAPFCPGGVQLPSWQTPSIRRRRHGPEVVIDGNWVTSRKPDDLEQFNQAMLGAPRQ